ncbi:MAG: phytanoyl-CoA dioxygenase family protein [Chitinophagaceae bacterium]
MKEILNLQQINRFVADGYICIENAFDANLAKQAREILWKDIPADPNNRSTWTQPVIRLGMYSQEPFVKAANTALLQGCFDQLLGPGNWLPCGSMGAFPIRFPSDTDAGDTGWHVDAGFAGTDPANFFEYRINLYSKGRGLLMLFLFSDVGENDAPTRLRKASHFDIARLLAPEAEKGLSFMQLAEKLSSLPEHEIAYATGKAGTVYLCHPFLIHAAQPHRGSAPKFMAQPPLITKQPFTLTINKETCPVERAIIEALHQKGNPSFTSPDGN